MIALGFLLLTGYVLQQSRGQYSLPNLILFLLGFVGFAVACIRRREERLSNRALGWGLLLSSCLLLLSPRLIYPESAALLRGLRADLFVAFLAAAGLLWCQRARPALFPKLAWIAALALLAARVLTILISKHPFIDVFTSNTQAADYFLSGHNPYAGHYDDIYHGSYDYTPGFVYWPGVLLWIAPARFLFGDIRAALVVADALTAFCLYRWRRAQGASPEGAWWVALLWASFPVSLLVIEQSWIDPLLVLGCVAAAWLFVRERWVAAAIALGLVAATKQYGFLVALVTAAWLGGKGNWREALRVAFVSALVAVLLLVPFLIPDPEPFLRSTIKVLAHQQMRADSFSLPALFAREWNVLLSSGVTAAVSGLALVGIGVAMLRRKLAWAPALALLYGVIFLFGKQAFCNYYYFSSCFVLLAIADERINSPR